MQIDNVKTQDLIEIYVSEYIYNKCYRAQSDVGVEKWQ
jgi:hypothetical protein